MTASLPVVPVPPDVDVEDRLVGRLTFRHLGYLLAAGGGAAIAISSSPLVLRIIGALLSGVAATGAIWRPGGRPIDAWVLPLLRYVRRQRAASAAAPAAVAGGADPSQDDEAAADLPSSDPAGAARRRPWRRVTPVVTAVVIVLAISLAAARLMVRTQSPPVPQPHEYVEPHLLSDKPSQPNQDPPPAPTSGEVPDADDLLIWLEQQH